MERFPSALGPISYLSFTHPRIKLCARISGERSTNFRTRHQVQREVVAATLLLRLGGGPQRHVEVRRLGGAHFQPVAVLVVVSVYALGYLKCQLGTLVTPQRHALAERGVRGRPSAVGGRKGQLGAGAATTSSESSLRIGHFGAAELRVGTVGAALGLHVVPARAQGLGQLAQAILYRLVEGRPLFGGYQG